MAGGTTINRPTRMSAARPALLRELIRTVRQRRLFARGQHLLVAVSGGPDSIALLSLLDRLRPSWSLTLTVVHFNYGLRGAESDGDESFVRTFCVERHLELIVQRPSLPRAHRDSSLQAVARDARYAAMAQLADEVCADRIVLGHTADDQAETIVMWMLRGAGLSGLAGMPYRREGRIVRPLLSSTRADVLAYLAGEQLSYRQDSSNDSSTYRRNRIRHDVMPAMTRVVPAAARILQRQADLLRDDEEYLEEVTRACVARLVKAGPDGAAVLDRPGFAALSVAIQRRVLRSLLRRYDEQSRASRFHTIESVRRCILSGRPDAKLSTKQAAVLLERTVAAFAVHRIDAGSRPSSQCRGDDQLIAPVPSSVTWAKTKQTIQVQLMSRSEAERAVGAPSKWRGVFDADRLHGPLMIRAWRAGDRFCPQGMKGRSKKLQDFFSDLKVGRADRRHIPLLVGTKGIAWIIGLRQDERYIVSEQTTRCLVVSVNDAGNREGAR